MLSYTNEVKIMSKKIKTLISVLIIALLLTVGATATVMAEEAEETTPPPEASGKGLLERVADILEIDKEDLIDAFKQARQEMMGDTFREWWGQKPEVMEPGMFKHNLRSRIWPRFHLQNGSRAGFCPGLPGEAD